jgi:hypothetical protein
MMVALLL